jgi:hypothetical protein
MEPEVSILEEIVHKNEKLIASLEPKLEEAKKKLEIAKQAIALIEERNAGRHGQHKAVQTSPSPSATATDGKYSGMTLGDAITDILSNHAPADSGTIHKLLIENGFTSTSSDTKRDVYVKLNKLCAKNKIAYVVEAGVKRYMIKPASVPDDMFQDRDVETS